MNKVTGHSPFKKAASYNKQKYDGKIKGVKLVSGDRVLVKNVKDKGKLKSF